MIRKLVRFLDAIKFQHTVFALPFAFLAAFQAVDGFPGWGTCGLLLLAMVTARSAAMGFNRIADRRFDRENPRTGGWAVASGEIGTGAMGIFTVVMTAGFLATAYAFNGTAFLCAPGVLILLLGYSLTKRFTWLCHFVLGAALGCAPPGAWIAMTEAITWPPMLLGISVLFWTAGFDLLYSCQDIEFDRKNGLHSIPARFGKAAALWIARGCHLLCFAGLVAYLVQSELGIWFTIGVGATGVLLLIEHWLMRSGDLKKLGLAFLPLNGAISILLGITGIVDLMIRSG